MTIPKDQYPKGETSYPNGPPEAPALQAELYRLAPSKVTVLLVGGNAALQRSAARALHDRSPRAGAPFEVVEGLGLDSEQWDRELFGGPAYAPNGAGAIHRVGAGTLYVATIHELPLLAQPRFLRFLDEDRKARVVTATAHALTAQVALGQFRRDLAERLGLVALWLPTTLETV
jgi:DNA-binding NtrC family response regulator